MEFRERLPGVAIDLRDRETVRARLVCEALGG